MRASTRTQDAITLYLTQMGYDPDTTYLKCEGEGSVIVETPQSEKKLTINLYEDIVEIRPDGSQRIIAESDLPHEKNAKTGRKMATSWKQKEGEEE